MTLSEFKRQAEKIQKHNDLNRAFMIKYLQAVVIGSLNGLLDALNKPLKVKKE